MVFHGFYFSFFLDIIYLRSLSNFSFTEQIWKICTRWAVSLFATPGAAVRRRSRKSRWRRPASRLAENSPIGQARVIGQGHRSSFDPSATRDGILRDRGRDSVSSTRNDRVIRFGNRGVYTARSLGMDWKALSGFTLSCVRHHTRVRVPECTPHVRGSLDTCAYLVTPNKYTRLRPIQTKNLFLLKHNFFNWTI